jgi:hypothetical protein
MGGVFKVKSKVQGAGCRLQVAGCMVQEAKGKYRSSKLALCKTLQTKGTL